MNIKCIFGHKWKGCACVRCGENRDSSHKWEYCKCSICGKTKNEGHKWVNCRCGICNSSRNEHHSLDSDCKCSVCNEIFHLYDNNFICRQCSQTKNIQEIASIVWNTYLFSGVIIGIARFVAGNDLEHELVPRDIMFRLFHYWRIINYNIISSAQNSYHEGNKSDFLKKLNDSCVESYSKTSGKIQDRLWGSEAKENIKNFLANTWALGKFAGEKKIEDFVYTAVSLVGEGFGLTRAQGKDLILELYQYFDGLNNEKLHSTNTELSILAPYDTTSVNFHLTPIITNLKSKYFDNIILKNGFDLQNEITYHKSKM